MSLQGVLSDFGVADVFQLIAQQRKTGVLAIEGNDQEFEVHFLEGQVVRSRPSEARPDAALASFLLRTGGLSEPDLAEARRYQEQSLEPLPDILISHDFVPKAELEQLARLLSEETIFELFLLDDGRFQFRPGPVQEEPGDLLVGAEMVLLDALRMRDEWAAIASGIPDLSAVVSQAVDPDTFMKKRAEVESAAGMSGEELDRLFSRCDGRLSARRVIDLSRLGTFQGARGIQALLQAGQLEVVHRALRPSSLRVASAGAAEPWARGVWILLVAGLVAGALFAIPRPRPVDYPLPPPSFADAQHAAHLEHLRAALEAYRWEHGRYPERLADLRQGGAHRLAGVPLDQYSYVRSEEGYLLGGAPGGL